MQQIAIRFYKTRWDLLPQLSQERFELEQIYQWLKYAPR